MNKSKPITRKIILYVALIVLSVLSIVPFWWMIISSVKPSTEIFTVPIQWWPKEITWSSYSSLFNDIPFMLYIFNSSKITILTTIGQLSTSILAAYAFAKLRFPGRDALFLGYLGTLMIPWHAIMIPQFDIITSLGLYNSHWALIVLHLFNPFGVFLLRQFFLGIPMELSEAARIDGCGEFRLMYQIIVPLCKPAMAALTIFTFKGTWNDYLGPLIYLDSPEKFTIQIGLKNFIGENVVEYGPILAGAVICTLPVLVIFVSAQKFFIEGVAMTGIKG